MENITTKTFVTTDHTCVLHPGGLFLVETEKLDEETDLSRLVVCDEALLLSPGEALRIAAVVEQAIEAGGEVAEEATRLWEAAIERGNQRSPRNELPREHVSTKRS